MYVLLIILKVKNINLNKFKTYFKSDKKQKKNSRSHHYCMIFWRYGLLMQWVVNGQMRWH